MFKIHAKYNASSFNQGDYAQPYRPDSEHGCKSLSECAAKYRGFCKRYKPQPKPDKSYHWGSKLLPKVVKHKSKKTSPPQMRLPGVEWEFENSAVREVAEQVVVANCYEGTRYGARHRRNFLNTDVFVGSAFDKKIFRTGWKVYVSR